MKQFGLLRVVIVMVLLAFCLVTSACIHFNKGEGQYALTVNISGSGSVTKNPNQATYTDGTVVQLTATANPGWSFIGWSGDLSGNTNPASITMSGNKIVTATFTQNQYTLTVNITGSGSVTKNPQQATYNPRTPVQLTATATSGYCFTSWSGDVSSTSPTLTITMDSDKRVTANFLPRQRIEYTMPGVPVLTTYTVTYSKFLQAGDRVDGYVQLSGQYYSADNTYQWTFQILGPGGESIHSWTGHWVNNNYHSFGFTASYTGSYTLRVTHGSMYAKNLIIELCPPGWGYSGQ